MANLEVMHNDVKITYEEKRNLWTFSLRGRERSAESLAKAKEAIEKVPKEKNTFERVPVYGSPGYSSGYNLVTGYITSVCEQRGRSQEVNCVFGGDRGRHYASNVYPINDKNTPIVEKILEINKQIEALGEKRSSLHKGLIPYVPDKDDEQ